MINSLKRLVLVGLCVAGVSITAQAAETAITSGAAIQAAATIPPSATTGPKKYPDPTRWEKTIAAYEAKDKTGGTPTSGGVVCIGSSSMVYWHPTIARDLAPLNVIPRGFGGSMMNDAAFYAERMVVRYKPKAVVLYEGDNDIGAGMSPRQICDAFERFAATVHKSLPETRIYVLSIKPSLKRWTLWPSAQETNKLIANCCAKNPQHLIYVSVYEGMLGADGKPREDIYRADKLHMNAQGYEIWTKAVRSAVVTRETAVAGK